MVVSLPRRGYRSPMPAKNTVIKQVIPEPQKRHAPDGESIAATGRRVLNREAEALHALAAQMDGT